MKIVVKNWFFNKIKAENYGWHFYSNSGDMLRETEKAYQVALECSTIDGEIDTIKSVWVPKACTMSEDEAAKEAAAAVERFNAGCARYDALVNLAKENGIKGIRKGMKAATIRAKLAAAGVAC